MTLREVASLRKPSALQCPGLTSVLRNLPGDEEEYGKRLSHKSVMAIERISRHCHENLRLNIFCSGRLRREVPHLSYLKAGQSAAQNQRRSTSRAAWILPRFRLIVFDFAACETMRSHVLTRGDAGTASGRGQRRRCTAATICYALPTRCPVLTHAVLREARY